VAPPGGAFGVVQNYSASNSYDWVTPFIEGPYQVGVWVRNTGSTKSYEAFAFITFQVQTTATKCSTLLMNPTVVGGSVTDIYTQSPQATGTLLSWHASALGCTAAEYAFYFQGPGPSSAYKLMKPYGAGADAQWVTAGLPRGTYKVKVLARRANSTSAYDVFAISSYELV
jgi:hypothetical protein